jgi:hypothetical protein
MRKTGLAQRLIRNLQSEGLIPAVGKVLRA